MAPNMTCDEGLTQILRNDLANRHPTEKKMFGGLCFMLHGHMPCGIHKDGAMFRVGPDNQQAALALPGGGPTIFTGRAMTGFVNCETTAFRDDSRRHAFPALSLSFVKSRPAK